MLIFIVVLLIIISLYLLLTVPYLKFDISYKEKKLTLLMSFWFYKKKIVKDFSKETDDKAENINNSNNNSNKNLKKQKKDSKEVDMEDFSEKEELGLKQKFAEAKQKVFNPETGFNKEEAQSTINEFKETFSFYYKLIKKFLSAMRYKIYIPVCRVTLDYGTSDPALTGMLYGSAWNVIGFVYPFVARYAYAVYPMLDITPDFYDKRFDVKLKSIIKVRPVHIINALVPVAFMFLKEYLKDKK